MTVSITACNKIVTELLFIRFEKVIVSMAQGLVLKCTVGNALDYLYLLRTTLQSR